jgi:adenylyltransferase/sulfurtransferase
VLAPVVGVIGSLQATEALKLLAGIGVLLVGRLLIWDALGMEWRQMRLRKDPDCPVCSGK